jgi:hypothetical protein
MDQQRFPHQEDISPDGNDVYVFNGALSNKKCSCGQPFISVMIGIETYDNEIKVKCCKGPIHNTYRSNGLVGEFEGPEGDALN